MCNYILVMKSWGQICMVDCYGVNSWAQNCSKSIRGKVKLWLRMAGSWHPCGDCWPWHDSATLVVWQAGHGCCGQMLTSLYERGVVHQLWAFFLQATWTYRAGEGLATHCHTKAWATDNTPESLLVAHPITYLKMYFVHIWTYTTVMLYQVRQGDKLTLRYVCHCGIQDEPQENAELWHLPKAAEIYEGTLCEQSPTSVSFLLPPTHSWWRCPTPVTSM